MAGIMREGEGVSAEERAREARRVAEENRVDALERLADMYARGGAEKLAKAARVPGKVIEDTVVPAGEYWSREISRDTSLRIIDLEGRQAVDFLCFDARDPTNRYNAANTIKFNRSVYIGKGFRLYSDRADVLMIVEEDTVGWHDTIGGCCSSEANLLRYGIPGTPSCRNNFVAALTEHGLGPRDIPANINFFMYVPVLPDGATEIVEGKSEPGDFVDVRAENDVLVAISNCPQEYNPCNGWVPTPIRLILSDNKSFSAG